MSSKYASPTPVYAHGHPYLAGHRNAPSDPIPLVNESARPTPLPTRTPSPTPSEWDAMHSPKGLAQLRNKEFLFSKRGLITVLVWAFIITIIVILNVFNTQIVDALEPAGKWLNSHSYGFLIPIAILFILSFPPLFGQEIVEMLIGIAYGLWVGFVIAFVGRTLGEIANFFLFKYTIGPRLRAASIKSGKTNYEWLSLSKVLREGGFKIFVIFRYSAIPPHMVTALFAMCGINFWSFLGAVFLTAPKYLVEVLVGVYYGREAQDKADGNTNDTQTTRYEIVMYAATGVTTVVLIVAAHYIKNLQKKALEDIIYQRRKARQAQSVALNTTGGHSLNSSADLASLKPYSVSQFIESSDMVSMSEAP